MSNPLLIKPQLGKPIDRCFSLPPPNFTYGMKNDRIDGGAAEALGNWYTMPSGCMQNKKVLEQDFISLNKAAVESGLTTASEQAHFRATHDIRCKPVYMAHAKPERSIKMPPDMRFGVSTRPSTPMFQLIRHEYQAEWLEGMKEARQKWDELERQKKRQLCKVKVTRTSTLRKHKEPVDPGPYWHMKRFQNIPAQLDTFRNPNARTAAFHHHGSDATSRAGISEQGINEAAKS